MRKLLMKNMVKNMVFGLLFIGASVLIEQIYLSVYYHIVPFRVSAGLVWCTGTILGLGTMSVILAIRKVYNVYEYFDRDDEIDVWMLQVEVYKAKIRWLMTEYENDNLKARDFQEMYDEIDQAITELTRRIGMKRIENAAYPPATSKAFNGFLCFSKILLRKPHQH